MSINRYQYWQAALKGVEGPQNDGETIAGFYRTYWNRRDGGPEWHAVAIWYDESDDIVCKLSYTRGLITDRDKVLEIFAKCSRYPVQHDVYKAVVENDAEFPPVFQTMLTLEQAKKGVIWTLAIGEELYAAATKKAARKRAVEETKPAEVVQAAAVVEQPAPETAENERAVIGDNSRSTEPLTADQKMQASLQDAIDNLNAWLKSIDGKVTTDEQEKKAAGFVRDFKDFRLDATKAHKIEKQPILDAGRAIDAKWKAISETASSAEEKAARAASDYVAARLRREREEREKAQREAMAARAEAPVGAVVVERPVVSSGPTGGFKPKKIKVVIIDDIENVKAAFIASPTGIEAATEWAKRAGLTMTIPGTHVEEQEGMRA